MARYAWLTDIHLNFLSRQQIQSFMQSLAQAQYDALLITGDIAEAPLVAMLLVEMQRHLRLPIYFVLGNHDFYHSSVATVRKQMERVVEQNPNLIYMSQAQPIGLSPTTGLVGHDGWGDGRYGSYYHSPVLLNDFIHIQELARITQAERHAQLRRLGDVAAAHLRQVLPLALQTYEHVVVLTHVPPFMETCYHQGKPSAPDHPYLPFFACQATGDVLLAMAASYPLRRITVLCGHTHAACDVKIRPNMRVLCGQAEYRSPTVQQVLTI